jgi:alkylresorcinol/alkylpyrone synthase
MSQTSAITPRLVALATAVPPHDIIQDEIAERAARTFAFNEGGYQWLLPIYHNAQIRRRHSVVPIDWFLGEHSFSERNALFLEHSTNILTELAAKTLEQAGLKAQDIDAIVTVSSSGIATPALDARVMQRLPFRTDVERSPLFGLGCAGGVLGLSRATAVARAAPQSRVLLLVIELSTLTFRRQDRSKANLVATALFGDGAAAAIITCREDAPKNAPRLGPSGEHTWPDTLDIMGWDVTNDGLQVVFSRDIPTLVREELRSVVDTFLRKHKLSRRDVDEFVCHPGGAKVLDALEEAFELKQGALTHSRAVLREHGNMSSATVLFILRAALDAGVKGRCLLTTMGPGFTSGLMIVETA